MAIAGVPNPESVSKFRAWRGFPEPEHTGLIYRQRRGIFEDTVEDITRVGEEVVATITSVAQSIKMQVTSVVVSVATSVAIQATSAVVPIATSIVHDVKYCVQDVEDCVEVITEQLDEWIDAKVEIPITFDMTEKWGARKEIQIPIEWLPDGRADLACINCHLRRKFIVKTVMDFDFTAEKDASNADMDDFTCTLC